MTQLSLLLLGGGKRISLVQRFQAAAAALDVRLAVYAYEIDAQQPISAVAEIIIGKKWREPGVQDDIARVVAERGIDLIISNVDPATVIHAALKPGLPAAGFSADTAAVAICMSKKKTQRFCEEAGLPVIPAALPGQFPLFAKPDAGSASVGAMRVDSQSELDAIGKGAVDYIYQTYIDGVEYTVDAYVTREGVIGGVSPRVRVLTLGGESIITETIHDSAIVAASHAVIERLALRGPVTLQFMRRNADQALFLMEINPRFGGGVIASIEAGFDFPRMMLQELLGQTPAPVAGGKRLLMKRYFQEVFYEVDH